MEMNKKLTSLETWSKYNKLKVVSDLWLRQYENIFGGQFADTVTSASNASSPENTFSLIISRYIYDYPNIYGVLNQNNIKKINDVDFV